MSQVDASRSIQRNGDEEEASAEGDGEELESPVQGVAPPSLSLGDEEEEAAQDEVETPVLSLGPLTLEDEEEEELEGATLSWDNVAATFRTQNDRYSSDMLDIRGTRTIWHYSGGAARREEVEVTEESPAYWMTSGPAFGPPFIASTALKEMLTMDSTYTVTASGYTRYAPVNLIEDPEQVNFTQDRSFVYLPPASEMEDAVWSASEIRVAEVAGENVIFNIDGSRYSAPIAPQEGYFPFDFDLGPSGEVSNYHIGHAVHSLS